MNKARQRIYYLNNNNNTNNNNNNNNDNNNNKNNKPLNLAMKLYFRRLNFLSFLLAKKYGFIFHKIIDYCSMARLT